MVDMAQAEPCFHGKHSLGGCGQGGIKTNQEEGFRLKKDALHESFQVKFYLGQNEGLQPHFR